MIGHVTLTSDLKVTIPPYKLGATIMCWLYDDNDAACRRPRPVRSSQHVDVRGTRLGRCRNGFLFYPPPSVIDAQT